MLIALKGVLDDGPDRASGVPANPRTPMRWPLGASVTIRLDAVSKVSGAPLDLASPNVVKLEVRLRPLPLSEPKLLEITAAQLSPAVRGAVQFSILPADQREIRSRPAARHFFYDVWLTRGDGSRDPLIPTSPLYVEPSVTEIP